MENKVKRGIRPCNGRSIAICVITFLLTVVLLSLAITANEKTFKFLFVILGVACIILGVLLLVIYTYGYNSPIYIDAQSLSQKRFGKIIIFDYNEIDEVILKQSMFLKVPPIISLCCKKQKISFELTSDILDEISAVCSCDGMLVKINKIIRDNSI